MINRVREILQSFRARFDRRMSVAVERGDLLGQEINHLRRILIRSLLILGRDVSSECPVAIGTGFIILMSVK